MLEALEVDDDGTGENWAGRLTGTIVDNSG